MPYTPDSPPVGQIPQPTVNQNLNKFHVLNMDITLVPGDQNATKITVTWAEGYDDSGFKPVKTKRHTFDGSKGDADATELIAKLAKTTTGGSVYGEVKTAVWELLQARNLVGSGTIS